MVYTTEHSFCMIGTHAFKFGHVLVLPKRHVTSVAELNSLEAMDFLKILSEIRKLINDNFDQPCVTLQNSGHNSSQSHIHFHLLPMKKGARDFISEAEGTKLYPEVSTEELIKYKEKIKKLF